MSIKLQCTVIDVRDIEDDSDRGDDATEKTKVNCRISEKNKMLLA